MLEVGPELYIELGGSDRLLPADEKDRKMLGHDEGGAAQFAADSTSMPILKITSPYHSDRVLRV